MIRVAQIGVGYWGPNLLRNLCENERCRVVAVADRSEERRNFIRHRYPELETVEDGEVLLRRKDVDAVVLATPVETHYQLTKTALENEKHALVEKPLAKDPLEIGRLEAISKSHDKVLMAGHTFIFNPAVRCVRGLLESGEIGDIRYIHGQRLNLGRVRSDVDALWNFAPHDLSILQYWLDGVMPDSVHRIGVDHIQDGVEDVVFLTLKYPGKILAQVHVSWLDPRKVRRITLVGSKKMIVYDDVADQRVTVFDKGVDIRAELGTFMDFDLPPADRLIYRSGNVFSPTIDWKEPLRVEIDHFFDCIEGKATCLAGPAQARQIAEILQRAER